MIKSDDNSCKLTYEEQMARLQFFVKYQSSKISDLIRSSREIVENMEDIEVVLKIAAERENDKNKQTH